MWKIQDYALLGDCRSAALVSKDGSIDWLCWPRFDSSPVYSRILDQSKGHWSITATEVSRIQQSYIDHSSLLKTTFICSSGTVELTDTMAIVSTEEGKHRLYPEHEIVRKVECVNGQVEMEFELAVDAKRTKGRLENSCSFISWRLPEGQLLLYAPIKLSIENTGITAKWTMRQGDVAYFSLSLNQESPDVIPSGHSCQKSLTITKQWWDSLATQISYDGPYREHLVRSAMILKLMSFSPSGAIIASPTMSLPEKVGGEANWDYRYCWLRDASLATYALMNLNLKNEANAFVNWLLHSTVLSRPKLHVLYNVYGGIPPREREDAQFRGYFDSKPVRFGNAAMGQDQMDLYGEVIRGAYYVLKDEDKIDHDTQRLLKDLGEYICAHWQEPDAGMWEVRGKKEYFTHSLVTCWAGLHDILEMHRRGLIQKVDANRFTEAMNKIAQLIHQTAWNDQMKSFTSKLRGEQVDANLLLMPWYGFLPFDSPKMRQTYDRIKQDLGAKNGLFFRNREIDEGAFLLCSFWAVEYLARGGGTPAEAKRLLDDVLQHANNVGIWSEEIDPATGDFLGNYPLTFSHLGLVNAILAIGGAS